MKGVSTILGSTILLAVAISIAGIYSAFAGELGRQTGGAIAEDTRADIKCRSASVDIRDTEFISTPATKLDLVNTGTVDLRGVTAFAINDSGVVSTANIPLLSTGESRAVTMKTPQRPEYVTVGVDECPEIQTKENL